MKLHLGTLLGFTAAVSLSGCVVAVNEEFDPRGTDLSLSGDWRIELEGGSPEVPTPALCQQIGIAEVQLVLYPASGSQTFVSDTYRYACETGSFDSRPQRVLKNGNYRAEWIAYDEAGAEVARNAPTAMTIQDGHVRAPTAIFTAAQLGTITVEMKWGFLNGAGDGTCAQAMVQTVQATLKGAGVDQRQEGACRDSYVFENVLPGEYDLEVLGTNDKDDTWSVICGPITLEGSSATVVCTVAGTPSSG